MPATSGKTMRLYAHFSTQLDVRTVRRADSIPNESTVNLPRCTLSAGVIFFLSVGTVCEEALFRTPGWRHAFFMGCEAAARPLGTNR